MKKFYSTLLILVSIVAINAQIPEVRSLSKTEQGLRVLAYFEAFNSGNEQKLAKFFEENIDVEALKKRPVEARVTFHRQIRDDFHTVEIKRVVSVSDEAITVLAQSVNGGWISYTFEFDARSKKFSGFGIEQVDRPDLEGQAEKTSTRYPAPTSMAELLTTTEQLFSDLAKADAFSGVVMIAKDDKPIFAKAYGLADRDKKTANDLDTRFNLGSINKNFTRIAIGQLVRAGKLSFNDKLINILPDYPNHDAASKITIGQLVNMTSGIGDFFNDRFRAIDKKKLRTVKDYLPLFGSDPLEFEPGTKNRYSNGGYIVLGLVIERLSGMSYYDYVRENIFKPAGMTNSAWFAVDELPANTARGYIGSGLGRTSNQAALPGRGSSAGGGYSNASDLLKFSLALRSNKLEIPNDEGSFPARFEGIGIAGGTEGVNALFIANGQTGYTIIILSNYDPPSAEGPGMQVRDWIKNIKE